MKMKKSTQMIVNYYPNLKRYLEGTEKDTDYLNENEKTFLNLISFFEKPTKDKVDLYQIYNNLEDDWLGLALEAIHTFLSVDNYKLRHKHDPDLLMKETSSPYVTKDYFNQKQFAEFLTNHGVPYSEAKLSVYISRGIIPPADFIISNRRYWSKQTCHRFLKELTNKH